MTNEFIVPQISIKSVKRIPTVADILLAKRQNDEIYYKGKLLSNSLDKVYKETLIDYAALTTLKHSYPPGEIQEMEDDDFGYLSILSFAIGSDLRNLFEYEKYKQLFIHNHLALRLISATMITGDSQGELELKLINGLDEIKKIIDKIEEDIDLSN